MELEMEYCGDVVRNVKEQEGGIDQFVANVQETEKDGGLALVHTVMGLDTRNILNKANLYMRIRISITKVCFFNNYYESNLQISIELARYYNICGSSNLLQISIDVCKPNMTTRNTFIRHVRILV
eukprot:41326_1